MRLVPLHEVASAVCPRTCHLGCQTTQTRRSKRFASEINCATKFLRGEVKSVEEEDSRFRIAILNPVKPCCPEVAIDGIDRSQCGSRSKNSGCCDPIRRRNWCSETLLVPRSEAEKFILFGSKSRCRKRSLRHEKKALRHVRCDKIGTSSFPAPILNEY